MRILRLELQGFKSFKDKTIVQFNQPITAIVGSNGCGKSNVVDALYWVMGDMSPKHLRGASMTDVIFSGTKTTSPLDMAEVTLVLERDPEKDAQLPPQFQTMSEVQITRRYYRHGESEYFINRVHCRLRDIQEFFMDTGIGAKSYSIIEQGAITRMVGQKPEERRLVIEDVAGITKFKARRAETERKLEQSNLNLQRVDDLVKDLQKQLSTLQRQADKAQKFKEWSDELRDLEIRTAGKEWVSRRDRLTKSKDETVEHSTKLTQLEAELTEARATLQKDRAELETLETDLALVRSSRQQEELELKEKQGELQSIRVQEETLGKRQKSNEEQKEELNIRSSKLTNEIAEVTKLLEELEVESSGYIQKIESLRLELEKIRGELDEARHRHEEKQRVLHAEDLAISTLSHDVQSEQRQTLQLDERQQAIEETRGDIERELSLKSAERAGAEKLLQDAFSERRDLESQKETIDARIQSCEDELARKQDELLKNQEQLVREKGRFHHLEELQKNLEGIGDASRVLALHLKESRGIQTPLIADQIRVPQLLERAVEAALGELLETVAVKDFEAVEELIGFIKNSSDPHAKAARVRFFVENYERKDQSENIIHFRTPMGDQPGPDNIVAYASETPTAAMTLDRYLREHPAVVGKLDELLTLDEQIPAWAKSFDSWWVVRDRASFQTLRPSLSKELTLVSLEGDVCHPSGYLDLAPVEENPNSSHLVQRKREFEELKIKVDERERAVVAFQENVEALKKNLQAEREAYKLLTQRLISLNPGLQKHTDLIRELEAQVARLSEKKDNLSNEYAQNSEKFEMLKISLNAKNESLLRKSEIKAHLEAEQNEILKNVETIEVCNEEKIAGLEELRKKYDALLSQLTTKKTAQATLLQEQNHCLIRLQQIDTELHEISSTLHELSQKSGILTGQVQIGSEKLQRLLSEENTSAEKVRVTKKNVLDFEKKVSDLQIDTQKEFESLKNLEQDSAVNEVEIRNIEEKITVSYQLRLGELPAEELQKLLTPSDLEEELNPNLNREKIERLRGKIDRLGKINMVAMEEYQELSRRYEYLYVQRQDLADAIKSLFDAIARIDQESRERFSEAFTSVNESFQKTFPLMFGGGQAELKLTQPDNMLESGVEIVAQPPGKKLQSVTLLSGGEKALTAVSLIFGIFNIKPSPFAVLDEVDAPLDDTNVGRFNVQVRRMAEASQIIIITHHKHTMEAADALYGVTMEEPGISKLASARLSNL